MKEEYIQIMEEYQDMPLRDVVFHTLRKSILRGHLKPDERLMEIKLSEELGVSRTPIREAIRMLQLEGLVVNVPRKGTTVAKITEKDLKEVLELRESENLRHQVKAHRLEMDVLTKAGASDTEDLVVVERKGGDVFHTEPVSLLSIGVSLDFCELD